MLAGALALAPGSDGPGVGAPAQPLRATSSAAPATPATRGRLWVRRRVRRRVLTH